MTDNSTYRAVIWKHKFCDEPIELYYELDGNGGELRKIEVFADGHIQRADANHDDGSTWLSLEPHPSLSEIASQPEFDPRLIDRLEFELLWHS